MSIPESVGLMLYSIGCPQPNAYQNTCVHEFIDVEDERFLDI